MCVHPLTFIILIIMTITSGSLQCPSLLNLHANLQFILPSFCGGGGVATVTAMGGGGGVGGGIKGLIRFQQDVTGHQRAEDVRLMRHRRDRTS